jgi:hypothetical protein
MKEWYFNFFGLTLVIALPDGSDGWLWRSEFEPPKSRHIQTSLFALRIVESYMGWVGVEFVFLILAVLLKWDAPNKASTRLGAGATDPVDENVAPSG